MKYIIATCTIIVVCLLLTHLDLKYAKPKSSSNKKTLYWRYFARNISVFIAGALFFVLMELSLN